MDIERVVVVGGDTAVLGYGNGTIASRVAAVAGPAVARTAREVARRARLVAGELLECAPTDVVLAAGRAHVVGVAGRGVALGDLARASLRSPTLLREGAPGLHACAFFRPETVTWAFGAHACALEVDVETGALRLLRYAAVHDCGRPLNPVIVEGQLHGGIVQGIGAALAEELVYDGEGQLVTGSLMEYGVPKAAEVPPLDVIALDFPSTRNEMGVKGVGESGIISPVPAIANAVEDALADRGVEVARAAHGRQRLGGAAARSAAVGVPVVPKEVHEELLLVLGRNRRAVLDHAIERVGPALGSEALLHGDFDAMTDHAAHDQLPARRPRDRRVLSGCESEAQAYRDPGGERQDGRSPQATPHQP